MSKSKMITMPRDAKTGRIVTQEYAEKHPSTTTIEHRKVPVKPKGK